MKWSGGLGSSHTTPRGAAVPARPPTRCVHIMSANLKAQWSKGPNLQGTWVLVPLAGRAYAEGIIKSIAVLGLGITKRAETDSSNR